MNVVHCKYHLGDIKSSNEERDRILLKEEVTLISLNLQVFSALLTHIVSVGLFLFLTLSTSLILQFSTAYYSCSDSLQKQ